MSYMNIFKENLRKSNIFEYLFYVFFFFADSFVCLSVHMRCLWTLFIPGANRKKSVQLKKRTKEAKGEISILVFCLSYQLRMNPPQFLKIISSIFFIKNLAFFLISLFFLSSMLFKFFLILFLSFFLTFFL